MLPSLEPRVATVAEAAVLTEVSTDWFGFWLGGTSQMKIGLGFVPRLLKTHLFWFGVGFGFGFG